MLSSVIPDLLGRELLLNPCVIVDTWSFWLTVLFPFPFAKQTEPPELFIVARILY